MKNLPFIDPKLETEKIVSFLKKTFREQKIDKVVLGLSGGIDSSVALYLLKKVLPGENIFAVQMDYKPRNKTNIDLKGVNVINFSIKKMVYVLEKNIHEVSVPNFLSSAGTLPFGVSQVAKNSSPSTLIKDEVDSNFSRIKFEEPSLSKSRLGNIMARTRMIILFDLAKQIGGLVCGTENKSERLLGYFTRFGDAASDIEPIAHLYKTQVRQLASFLKIPKKIIDQSPTAGLWEGQTDESDFGFTYEEADQVLYYFHDRNLEIKEIRKLGYKNAEKIIKRFKDNQFKQKTPYYLK